MAHVAGARSYHMTHRVGWRDPTTVEDWERIFHDAHPGVATRLMSFFWLSLAGDREDPRGGQDPLARAARLGRARRGDVRLRRAPPTTPEARRSVRRRDVTNGLRRCRNPRRSSASESKVSASSGDSLNHAMAGPGFVQSPAFASTCRRMQAFLLRTSTIALLVSSSTRAGRRRPLHRPHDAIAGHALLRCPRLGES